MKKLLPLFFLALTINAFAQNNPALPYPPDLKSKIAGDAAFKTLAADFNNNGLHSPKDFAKDFENQKREVFGEIQVFDSIYYWTWDTLSTKWVLDSKAINLQYNSDGLPTSYTYQFLNGTVWENSSQYNITYDANNNTLTVVLKGWNGTSFQNIYQDVYTYDANNNRTSDTYQEWNGTAWANFNKYIYTYDANNNRITSLEQDWTGTIFENYSLSTFTYDANGNLLSEVDQTWNDIDLVWENSSRFSATYDANNNQLTSKYQYWNISIVDWNDSGLYTNTYDANNNQINQLYQYWDQTQWVNATNYIETYNASNELTNTLSQSWNTTNWGNSARGTYSYNGNHQLIRFLYELWDGSSWVKYVLSFNAYGENDFLESYSDRYFESDGVIIDRGDSTFNFFHTITATHNVPTDDVNITVTPNPSTGKFTVNSKDAMQNVVVYNLLGQRVYSADQAAKGKTSIDLNLADFGKGIYLVNVSDGTKFTTRKVVIQ